MQTQKPIKALREIPLIARGKLALKMLADLGKKARQVQQTARMRLIRGRKIKEDGSRRAILNIVVDVCQIGRMRFALKVT